MIHSMAYHNTFIYILGQFLSYHGNFQSIVFSHYFISYKFGFFHSLKMFIKSSLSRNLSLTIKENFFCLPLNLKFKPTVSSKFTSGIGDT